MVGSFDARDFPPDRVLEAKRGQRVSVCVPARNEEETIVGVVDTLIGLGHAGVIDEVVVIDDSSTDATADLARRAGAVVWESSSILPGYSSGPGKGEAMWRGVHVTDGDIVAFCDADVRQFGPAFVLGLVGPLLEQDDLGFVKAFYRRPFEGRSGEGGRVTELMARPLVATLFPHLSPVLQPLAGEFAARREVLEGVPFAGGYAVDLGLLVDVSARWGVEVIAQCDLGRRIHRNRPLTELGPQALAILQLGLDRSGIDPGAYLSHPAHPVRTGHPGRDHGPGAGQWSTVLVRPDAPDAEVALRELPPLAWLDVKRRPA